MQVFSYVENGLLNMVSKLAKFLKKKQRRCFKVIDNEDRKQTIQNK